MEIKPESIQEEDHRDLRYTCNNTISNKGKKIMNKKAYEYMVGLVLNKQANNIPGMGDAWRGAMGGFRQAPASQTTVSPYNTRKKKEEWSAGNWRAML